MARSELGEVYQPISPDAAQSRARDLLTAGYRASSFVEESFWKSADLTSVRGYSDEESCHCFGPDALTWTNRWVFVAPAKYSPKETLYLDIEMVDKGVEVDVTLARMMTFPRPFEEFLKRKTVGKKIGLEMVGNDWVRSVEDGIGPEDNLSGLSVEVYDPKTQEVVGQMDRTYVRLA